jgi:tRNA(adenine34) deaminase
MCSLSIRETRISRIVYALQSPLMGGHSKWPILRDADLSRKMPEGFGVPPEIVAGLLAEQAAQVWHEWNPLVWRIIQARGCLHTRPFHRWEPLFQPTPPFAEHYLEQFAPG